MKISEIKSLPEGVGVPTFVAKIIRSFKPITGNKKDGSGTYTLQSLVFKDDSGEIIGTIWNKIDDSNLNVSVEVSGSFRRNWKNKSGEEAHGLRNCKIKFLEQAKDKKEEKKEEEKIETEPHDKQSSIERQSARNAAIEFFKSRNPMKGQRISTLDVLDVAETFFRWSQTGKIPEIIKYNESTRYIDKEVISVELLSEITHIVTKNNVPEEKLKELLTAFKAEKLSDLSEEKGRKVLKSLKAQVKNEKKRSNESDTGPGDEKGEAPVSPPEDINTENQPS